MKKNMGSADKVIRLLLAAVIILLFILNVVSGILGYVLLAFAFIFIVTSMVSFCPLYTIFGIKTCKK
ncbi:MAG TPA: DUF2892 domain-containing protein [Bacteroidales bacterium]|nr:DUF2892 domain-containing protein [Bacteroidales bacterium]HPI85928.1 DUF2892 domain-containing protein [Bacteroidales bacterium]HPM93235.1 DUF2892 domain-containing protein [Bacteroidales bacterium]